MLDALFLLGGCLLITFVSYRLPTVAIVLYLLFGVFPNALTERFPIEVYEFSVGWGLQAVDVVLVGMVSAVGIEISRHKEKRALLQEIGWPLLFLLLYFLFEVVRNVSEYGLSAPGEFRYRYFMILSMFYTALIFDTEAKRAKLLVLLTTFTIISIHLLWLGVGLTTGWRFGALDRFIHSSLSLALAESFFVLIIARKYALIKMSRIFVWLLFVPTFVLIILDGHRSVWMCIFFGFVILNLLKELHFAKQLKILVLAGVAVLLVGATFFQGFEQLGSFLSERANAYFDVQEDPTASWRAKIWFFAFDAFLNKPFFGDGFGAHGASVYNPEAGIAMKDFIHSYYMMSLVKLGIFGMGILIFYAIRLGRILRRGMLAASSTHNPEYCIILAAFVILIVVHIYGVPYGLEYHSWLFIGLGLSVSNSVSSLNRNRLEQPG